MLTRPEPTEYAGYYENYISLAGKEDIRELLSVQLEEALELLPRFSDAQANDRYAPGKWSVKELLNHVIDAERIFAYRALRIARGDTTPLPGFEQDVYVPTSHANDRRWYDLIEEFAAVRRANLFLWRNLRDEDYARLGTMSGNPVSARAIAYISYGHARHHFQILQERYTHS